MCCGRVFNPRSLWRCYAAANDAAFLCFHKMDRLARAAFCVDALYGSYAGSESVEVHAAPLSLETQCISTERDMMLHRPHRRLDSLVERHTRY